jgi:hypothetical protein
MKSFKYVATLTVAIAGLTTHADATPITYRYIGNDFTVASGEPGFTTNDNITASFTVSGPLAPSMTFDLISIGATMATISNGVNTLPVIVGMVTTDASGNIVAWALTTGDQLLPDGSLLILESDNDSAVGVEDLAVENRLVEPLTFSGFVVNDPGMWSSGPATVPDQASTLALLCLALVTLLGFKYAQHKSVSHGKLLFSSAPIGSHRNRY